MMRGLTLVETVITIAITTMMLLALTTLYLNFNSVYAYQQTVIATNRAAGGAVNALSAALLPADHVVASYAFSGGTLSSGATTLVLELPSMDASGNSIANAYDYIAFYLTGTDLYRKIAAGAGSARVSGTKRVATLVTSFSCTYDNVDFTKVTNVATDIVTQITTRKGLVQTHLHAQFYLRNI